MTTMPCPTRMEGGLEGKFTDYIKTLPYSFIGSLRVTIPTAGTPVQFSTSRVLIDAVLISGNTGNGGVVTVGDQSTRAAAATQRGIVILAANPPLWLPISDLFLLWADTDTNNDSLTVAYFRY